MVVETLSEVVLHDAPQGCLHMLPIQQVSQPADMGHELPDELIAQRPPTDRDGARLLVVDAERGHRHATIRDLPELLEPALWVVNDTRVIPARLHGHKPTGGAVELLTSGRLFRIYWNSPDCVTQIQRGGRVLERRPREAHPPGRLDHANLQ